MIGTDGRFDDFYQSANGGDTWVSAPFSPVVQTSQSSFGWWFGHLFVDPALPNHVFVPGVFLLESYDGGVTFGADVQVHADQHTMAWDPNVTGRVYLGNDGGFYRSESNGAVSTYTKATYLPNNQFYTVDVGEQDPARVVGGLQDQGSVRSYGSEAKQVPTSGTATTAATGWRR